MRCPRHTLTIAALLSLITACGEDPVGPESPPTFRVEVSGEDWVPDFAVEVCDGRPSMVEADLSYWLDTVGRFCPWGATVVERLS